MQIFLISLPTAVDRRNFQKIQLSKLKLKYDFINAISINDLESNAYNEHYYDWQRPLKNTEIACYYSHRLAWSRVIESQLPALILEDDALISRCTPEILLSLNDVEKIDLVNLENRNRKKFVSKGGVDITCNSKLFRLFQDRTGAAGYILWPSGAEKLILCEKAKGIALADAHITSCSSLISYQVEPSPIIQLDQCNIYGIENSNAIYLSKSSVSSHDKPKGELSLRIKRVYYQIKLGLRQFFLVIKSERRYIKIRTDDFQ